MPTYTLDDLVTRVLDRLDQNELLYDRFEEIPYEINQAIITWNLFTGNIQVSVQVPGFSIANQFVYPVPDGILCPLRVAFEGRQLQRQSLRDISLSNSNWLQDLSTQTYPVQDWVPIDLKTFAIHPADSSGGNDLFVTGIAEPKPLVDGSDPITLPDEDAQLIEEMAASQLQFKEGGKIFSDSSAMYQRFMRGMGRKMRWQKTMVFPRYFVKTKGAAIRADLNGENTQ